MGGFQGVKDEISSEIIPITISGGGIYLYDGSNSAIKATVLDLTNSNPLATAIVDASGNQITSFGGGTQYTEGDTDASITGVAIMWEDGSDTLRAVSAAKPLPVDLQDTNVTVIATNLDIRDIDAATDDITIHGDVGVIDQLDLTNSNPIVAAIVDANGDQITAFGGGTQYTEDAAAAANPVGTALILVREDARAGSLTNTDGDNVAARGNNKGELYVIDTDANAKLTTIIGHVDGIEGFVDGIESAVDGIEGLLTTIDADTGILSGAVTGGQFQVDIAAVSTSLFVEQPTAASLNMTEANSAAIETAVELIDDAIVTDDAAFTPATTKVMMVGFEFDDTSPDSVNEGDAGAGRMSANRNQYVQIRDNAGNERGLNIDANGELGISAIRTSVTPGTAAANLGKAEDAAHASGDVGVMALAVRRDTTTASSGTSGDYEPLSTDATGKLWIVGSAIEDAAETAGGVLLMAGSVRRDTAASSAGTTGDNATINTDATGRLWVTATVIEDVAHSAGEAIQGNGVRRIDTPATSAGSSGDWATMDASAEGALWTTNTPTTTGGCTIFRSLDIDETEEDVKTSAGNVYGYFFGNVATSVRYLKFYNATAANVTVGSTTPVMTLPLPASSSGHISFAFPVGFSTAICVACTTGVADADTGAPAANDVIINVFYK